MPCYHPLIAWRNKRSGDIVIYGDIRNEEWKKAPESLTSRGINPYTDEQLIIPCGQCTGCRLEYSRQWADRCYLESKMHEHTYWLTLTYDEDSLKRLLKRVVNVSTGEVVLAPSLEKKDLQGFLKRLREHWARKYNIKGLRFYGCGEYGSINHRPHFHVTIFGLDIPDLDYWYTSPGQGFPTFKSKEVEKIWGKGRVTINRNTWQTSAYTARYMLKKLKGRDAKEKYQQAGINPEFCLCSRNPGIGYPYYQAHKEKIYSIDGIAYAKAKGGASTRKPPKYFDKMYKAENPEGFEKAKKARKEIATKQFKYKLVGRTTLGKFEYLKIEEAAKEAAIKALARKLEV